MKYLLVLGLLLLRTTLAFAEATPVRGTADGRIRTALYDANQVYRIQGYAGYEVDLQFEPGESFVGIGAGDIEGLSFVAQDNHLFIKPKAARVSTNLTVLTTRRPYQFVYSASALRTDPHDPDVIFVVRFTYPPRSGLATDDVVNKLLEKSRTARKRNSDYWYCGSSGIQPTAAWDDGIQTRLRFAPRAEQPAVFVLNDDGSEALLNFSMEAGDVVVQRVVKQLVIRRGKLTGRIVNKGFTGSSERLESGTVSPGVERLNSGRRP
jgi:type IV secretion system protein VirB9